MLQDNYSKERGRKPETKRRDEHWKGSFRKEMAELLKDHRKGSSGVSLQFMGMVEAQS